MMYTNIPYLNEKDVLAKNPIRRLSKPVRINVRSLKKVPRFCNLIVRNGCPVRYKSGYLAPLNEHRFYSAQEVSDFLHGDGRKGLFRITRYTEWWSVTECIQMTSKKQALERASYSWFGFVFSWKRNDDVL